MDFNFITSRLATGGGITTAADVDSLVQAGITHVIDCRAEFDDKSLIMLSHPLLLYLWNGVEDDGLPKPMTWFQKSWRFAMPAFGVFTNKIYAHCAAGVNRGPSTAYAIMLALGFEEDYAKHLIHAARPATLVGIRYSDDAERALPLGW